MTLRRIPRWPLFISLMLIIACQRPLRERKEVYRASIDYLRAERGPWEPWHQLLVAERTEAPNMEERLPERSFGPCFSRTKAIPLGGLTEEFHQANKSTSSIRENLASIPDVILVPPSHYLDANGQFSWEKLFKYYGKRRANAYYLPSGLLSVSGIGFNLTGDRALIFVRYSCSLCGFGEYLLLRKKEKWSVEDECRVWVS